MIDSLQKEGRKEGYFNNLASLQQKASATVTSCHVTLRDASTAMNNDEAPPHLFLDRDRVPKVSAAIWSSMTSAAGFPDLLRLKRCRL
ncbi:hypothetical protein E2C01_013613 [Portunus trituberculatus]|uniref:Uncharacterized protein n=1 Tax=Portunus trituberculatus TaxID=210409 RepID=A0A5B7DGQ9_PORTR|nr:hypothetical protein [Portunus trituberculatus]